MASSELKEALKNAADAIAKYVQNVATMTVETSYVEVGGDLDKARLAARTIIRLDGDSESVIPMKASPDGTLVVDSGLQEVHQQNVQAAAAYRSEMLAKLLGVLNG